MSRTWMTATRVIFIAHKEPDRWVLPLIGPASIKSRMRAQLETMIVNLAQPISQSE